MWALTLIVGLAGSLWVAVGPIALEAGKRLGKRPPNAEFGFLRVIPMFPLLLLGAAADLSRVAAPWGNPTRRRAQARPIGTRTMTDGPSVASFSP